MWCFLFFWIKEKLLLIVEMNIVKSVHRWLLFFVLIQTWICIPLIVTGQSYQPLDYLTTADGLPANYVVASLVDEEGYLWILTKVGLCRYDGRKCVLIDLPFSTTDLTFINYMVEYPKGILWFIRSNGELMEEQSTVKYIYCYDKNNQTFIDFQYLFPTTPFTFADITSIKMADVLNKHRGVLFSINNQEVYHLKDDQYHSVYQADSAELIQYVRYRDEDIYQITSDKQLLEVSAKGVDTIQSIFFKPGDNVFEANYSTTIYGQKPSEDSSIIEPYFLRGLTFKFNVLSSFIENTPVIFSTSHADWINTEKNWIHINSHLNSAYSVPINTLSKDNFFTTHQIFQPNSSTLLFVGNNGVHAIQYRDLPFRKIQLAEKAISFRGMVALNQDTLIAHSYEGQLFIDRKSGQITVNKAFPTYHGYGITSAMDNTVWSGSHSDQVIQQASPYQDKTSYRIKNDKGQKVKALLPFYQESTKTIWLGTMQGLYQYSPPLDRFILFDQGKFADALSTVSIANFKPQQDSLWICTDKGIFLYKAEAGIVAHFLEDMDVIDLYIDQQHQYWIATRQKGVLCWNRSLNTIRYFDSTNGLSNNSTTCIYPDYLGNLWIPTFNGLNYLNTTDFSIQTFYEDDGIANNEFNFGAHLATADSFLYLAGVNGITEIDLRYSEENSPFTKSNLPLVLNQYAVYDNEGEIRVSTDFEEGIQLYHTDNFLDVDFSIVDFSGTPTFEFAYQVEGLHSDWIYKKADKLQLSKPRFGRYLLRIKAKGIDGRWSAQELSIPIISHRPFFLAWWFIVALLATMGAAVYGVFRLRFRYLKRKSAQLQKEVELRTETINEQLLALEQHQLYKDQVFSIIGHDLRSPILGMKHFSEKVLFLIREKRFEQLLNTATQFDGDLNRIHQLLDNLLNWSLLERGDYLLQAERLNVSQVLQESVALHQTPLKRKKITLDLAIEDALFILADPRALSTIFRNLLDNAIKNSPTKGAIKIALNQQQKQIQLRVENTYFNRDPFRSTKNKADILSYFLAQKGLGIKICDELIRMSGARWTIRYNEAESIMCKVVFTATLPDEGH
jgi:signal transduction histidine kinase